MSSHYEDDDDILDVKEKPIESYNAIANKDSQIFYADEVPLPEMSFEIESEDEIKNTCNDTKICLDSFEHVSRVDKLISPIPPYCDFELKSPLNTISDCGYSSQGSPNSIHDYPVNDISDDFLDIFPVLEGLN